MWSTRLKGSCGGLGHESVLWVCRECAGAEFHGKEPYGVVLVVCVIPLDELLYITASVILYKHAFAAPHQP